MPRCYGQASCLYCGCPIFYSRRNQVIERKTGAKRNRTSQAIMMADLPARQTFDAILGGISCAKPQITGILAADFVFAANLLKILDFLNGLSKIGGLCTIPWQRMR
jgi:hypothetical protein